nr:hypothetical protein [Nonomuraea typhae]
MDLTESVSGAGRREVLEEIEYGISMPPARPGFARTLKVSRRVLHKYLPELGVS